MKYSIVVLAKAAKNLQRIPHGDQDAIRSRIDKLADGLTGDVKRLKSFSPRYRMRVGNYRVLFDIDGNRIVIGLIGHRKDVYDG